MAVAPICHRSVDRAVVANAVECVLQHVEIGPPVNEVTVKAQPRRITVGEDKIGVGKVGGCEEEFVEERIERHRV